VPKNEPQPEQSNNKKNKSTNALKNLIFINKFPALNKLQKISTDNQINGKKLAIRFKNSSSSKTGVKIIKAPQKINREKKI